MNTTEFGEIINAHGILFERKFNASAEQVFDFISKPELLAQWFTGGDADLRNGGFIELRFGGTESGNDDQSRLFGMVTEYVRPTVYEYAVVGLNDWTSIVKFEVQQFTASETLLILSNTQLASELMPMVAAGWHAYLEGLAARLMGADAACSVDDRIKEVLPAYTVALVSAGILLSTGNPVLAYAQDNSFRVVDQQRKTLLYKFDNLRKDIFELECKKDLLSKVSDPQPAMKELGNDLDNKYRDLKQVELDIRDLGRVLQ